MPKRQMVVVNRLKISRAKQFIQGPNRQRIQAFAVYDRKARHARDFTGLMFDVGTHWGQQLEFLETSAKALGPLEASLVLLEEFDHLIELWTHLAVTSEERYASAALIETRTGLIEAKRDRLSSVGAGEQKRIPPQESGNIFCPPFTIQSNIGVHTRIEA